MSSKTRLVTLVLLTVSLCACEVIEEAKQSLRRATATPSVIAVEGQVRDAVTQLAIAGAQLETGLTTALADVTGSFAISVLGSDSIQVTAPGYETVEIRPQAGFPMLIELVPDAATTMEIIYGYESRGEFSKEYELLHPDVQAAMSREQFVAYMEDHRPFDLVEFSVGAGRTLTSTMLLGRAYENVSELPVQATVREENRVVQQSWLDYAAQVNGFWRWLRGPLFSPAPTGTAVPSGTPTQLPSVTWTGVPPAVTFAPQATPTGFDTVPAVPTPYEPLLPGVEAVVVSTSLPVHTGPGEWYAVALLLARGARVQILDWPRWVEGEPWYAVRAAGLAVSSWCNGAYLEQAWPTPVAVPTETAIPLPTMAPTPTGGWPMPPPIAFTSERDGDREVYVMNADGSRPRNITQNAAQDGSPSWSPARDRLAFDSDRNGDSDIFITGLDGSGLQQVTSSEANEIHPAWSPDGALIAYVSDADGDWDIYMASVTGAGAVQVTDNSAWDSWPAWSPDGRRLVYTSLRDGNFELYVYDLESGSEVRLTDNPASDAFPAWSPSGDEIAFTSARDGQLEIYVLALDAAPGTAQRLTYTARADAANRYPTWSPDGNWLAFTSWRDGNAEIYLMSRQGWGLTNLSNHPAVDEAPAWSK